MKALRQRINQRTSARRHELLSHRSADERDVLARWAEQVEARKLPTFPQMRVRNKRRNEYIISLYRDRGRTAREIGPLVGLTKSGVQAVLRRAGVRRVTA